MHVVVIAVYQQALRLPYVDELLRKYRRRRSARAARGDPGGRARQRVPVRALRRDVRRAAGGGGAVGGQGLQQKKPRTFAESKKYANTRQGQKEAARHRAAQAAGAPAARRGRRLSPASPAAARAGDGADADDAGADGAALSAEAIAANRAKLASKSGPKKKKGGSSRDEGGGGGGGGGGDDDGGGGGGRARAEGEGEACVGRHGGGEERGVFGYSTSRRSSSEGRAARRRLPRTSSMNVASYRSTSTPTLASPTRRRPTRGSAAGAAPALEKGRSSFFGGLRALVRARLTPGARRSPPRARSPCREERGAGHRRTDLRVGAPSSCRQAR